MNAEDTANNILVDFNAEGQGDLLGDSRATPVDSDLSDQADACACAKTAAGTSICRSHRSTDPWRHDFVNCVRSKISNVLKRLGFRSRGGILVVVRVMLPFLAFWATTRCIFWLASYASVG